MTFRDFVLDLLDLAIDCVASGAVRPSLALSQIGPRVIHLHWYREARKVLLPNLRCHARTTAQERVCDLLAVRALVVAGDLRLPAVEWDAGDGRPLASGVSRQFTYYEWLVPSNVGVWRPTSRWPLQLERRGRHLRDWKCAVCGTQWRRWEDDPTQPNHRCELTDAGEPS